LILRSGVWTAGKPGSSGFKVHLDGEPLPLAIAADVGQGWVTVLVTDDAGRIIEDGLGRTKTRKLKGIVKLMEIRE
jgi:hypothetical protein